MSTSKKYYLLSLLGIVLISFYPIFMGISVISDYIAKGSVSATDYPKYIIPYTPISLALMIAVAFMPLAVKIFRRFAVPAMSAISVGLFFIFEFLIENIVVMENATKSSIENWQTYMCIITPQALKSVGNVLIGEYNPAFKIHFYIISAVVILAVINCVYGFAQMIRQQDFGRKKMLIVQAVSAGIFIGLCILACFTAFYRTGQINVSPISAVLMSAFFVLFGLTAGIFAGSFLYRKNAFLSVVVPAVVASATTAVMYVGELILLNGSLYRFGTGFLFEPIGLVPFSIIDIAVILLSGAATFLITKKLKSH